MRGLFRIYWTILPAIICIMLATTFASQADTKLLEGSWDIRLSQGSDSSPSVEFSVKDSKLTGRFHGIENVYSLDQVEFDGKRLSFSWTYEGQVLMFYEATVENDRMTGTWWIADVSSQSFTALKRKPKLDAGFPPFNFQLRGL
jgi:hypothetical protein